MDYILMKCLAGFKLILYWTSVLLFYQKGIHPEYLKRLRELERIRDERMCFASTTRNLCSTTFW